ncbi:MAG TPA: hypothetical protein VGC91_02055 [Pyrinomonadaceae bacterium]|jgi:hypothetical protein
MRFTLRRIVKAKVKREKGKVDRPFLLSSRSVSIKSEKTVSRKGAGGAKEKRKELECRLFFAFSSLRHQRLCARFFPDDLPESQIAPLFEIEDGHPFAFLLFPFSVYY